MRAGYRCSMRGCGVLTVGPSDESPDATTSIGVASHIHAAAPGGRRYSGQMSPEERRDISNGIWLCGSHSIEIDRDEVRYTPGLLREMKEEHERLISEELNSGQGLLRDSDLIAVGPDIVVFGELLGTSGRKWSVRIDHFVQGSIWTLIDFMESFSKRIRSTAFWSSIHLATVVSWQASRPGAGREGPWSARFSSRIGFREKTPVPLAPR